MVGGRQQMPVSWALLTGTTYLPILQVFYMKLNMLMKF